MPSTSNQRLIRKQYRRERKKLKRKIQGFLLITAFILSVVLSIYQQFAASATDTTINGRHLLTDKEDDGYYINSLDEFPPLLFELQTIKNGAWVLNFCGMFYCFLGIAIICDDYFVPAIEVIVDKLQMSEDTAGATWMAAGGSAPELFTSFVGTFLAKSDVGFGTIVGSAVFNVLFIVGACAIFTSGKLKLQWWPFARDMSYYLLCLSILSLFFGGISRNQMYWYESLILLCMYLFYVFLMTKSEKIRVWFFSTFLDGDKRKLLEESETNYGSEISMQKKDDLVQTPRVYTIKETEQDEFCDGDGGSEQAAITPLSQNGVMIPSSTNGHHVKLKSDSVDGADDDDDESEEGLDLTFPSTWGARMWYILKMPLTYPIYYTLFDVSKDEYVDWWPWTFFGSLLWLGGLSYLMVWWAVVVGYAWDIPQEIMGLVFLAAGTSVPELFSCIIVAKKGQADMAVSASIGSNIFDVLVGLPLPWLSYSIIYGDPSGELKIDVEAHGLFLSILVLIAMLSGLLGIILINKWVLTHCMGYSMIILYVIFVAQDLLRHYFLPEQF